MIRVITKKLIKDSSHIIRVNDYNTQLTLKVKSFPGFIQSYKYWEFDELDKDITYNLYNIHDWDNIDSLKKWLDSEDRNKIHKKHDYLFNSIKHTILIEKKDNFTDFLL